LCTESRVLAPPLRGFARRPARTGPPLCATDPHAPPRRPPPPARIGATTRLTTPRLVAIGTQGSRRLAPIETLLTGQVLLTLPTRLPKEPRTREHRRSPCRDPRTAASRRRRPVERQRGAARGEPLDRRLRGPLSRRRRVRRRRDRVRSRLAPRRRARLPADGD